MTSLRSLALAAAVAASASLATPSLAQEAAPAPAAAPAAAAPQQPAAGAQSESRRPPRRRREVISREELMQSGATNLYDAVQRLRPTWIRGTSASNFSGGGQGFAVYQNNAPLGGLEALRQLSIEYATELRFLDSSEASNTLPGLGSRRVAGAIMVVTPGNNP